MHHQSTLFPPTTEERQCPVCGNPPKRSDATYCSYACSVVAKSMNVPAEKQCAICGVRMQRRTGEGATSWRRRETCSKECRYKYISTRISEVQPAHMPPPKRCEVCGKWHYKKPGESHPSWAKKKACSRKCAATLISQARSYEWQPKTCEWCGRSFEKRDDELGKHFSKRRCCSPRCQYDMMINTRLQGATSKRRYPTAWNARLKEQIRSRDGYACQECGVLEEGRAHHVHHIDYVRTNLDPNNLITLCHSCHSKTCNLANKEHYIHRYQAMMQSRRERAA